MTPCLNLQLAVASTRAGNLLQLKHRLLRTLLTVLRLPKAWLLAYRGKDGDFVWLGRSQCTHLVLVMIRPKP